MGIANFFEKIGERIHDFTENGNLRPKKKVEEPAEESVEIPLDDLEPKNYTPITDIKQDLGFMQDFVAKHELTDEFVDSIDDPAHATEWQERYEQYKAQETAKKNVKEFIERELGGIEKELKIKFTDKDEKKKIGDTEEVVKSERKRIFEAVFAEIETLAVDEQGVEQLRSFNDAVVLNGQKKEMIKAAEKEVAGLRAMMPGLDFAKGKVQRDAYKYWIEQKNSEFFKSKATKKVEAETKKILGLSEEEKLEDQMGRMDRIGKALKQLEKLDASKREMGLFDEAQHTLAEVGLAKALHDSLEEVLKSKTEKTLADSIGKKDTGNPDDKFAERAEQNHLKAAQFCEDMQIMDFVSREGKREFKKMSVLLESWARKPKTNGRLDDVEREDYEGYLQDVLKLIGKYIAEDKKTDEFKKHISDINEALVAVQGSRKELDPKVNHDKGAEYLAMVANIKKYQTEKADELKQRGAKQEVYEATAFEFLSHNDDLIAVAIKRIEEAVEMSFGKVKGDLENKIDKIKNTEAFRKMNVEVKKIYNLCGLNEEGKKIAREKMLEKLQELSKEESLKDKRLFVIAILEAFKKDTLGK